MASQGPLLCGTGADDASVGTQPWINPGNITLSDDTYAVSSGTTGITNSHWLVATNFGFTIPSGATILGIQADWEYQKSGAATVFIAQDAAVKGGVIGGTSLTASPHWTTSDTTETLGGPTNLYGTTWTAADVNASNFGFVIRCTLGIAATAKVDSCKATVYYTEFDAAYLFRSQTRVFPVRHTNRSTVSAGVLEMSLVTEPTRAAFVAGRAAPPAPAPATKTIAFSPPGTPPDQPPPLGWAMQTKGQAPRGPWVPNRSTFRIPLEQTPPFPDSWLTVSRRVVNEPSRGRPRTWFALPLERTPPNPDSWLTVTRKGVLPTPRAGRTQTWQVLKPFDFPLASVLGRSVRPSLPGSTRFAFVPALPDALPSVVMTRGVNVPRRGSSATRFVPFLTQEAADISALFLKAARPAVTPRRPVGWITSILESTSTGILTLGWLKPFVARPLVSFGRPANSTRIAWVPQTISTAFRQDNRNARGRSRNDIVGAALPNRNQTGIGNT